METVASFSIGNKLALTLPPMDAITLLVKIPDTNGIGGTAFSRMALADISANNQFIYRGKAPTLEDGVEGFPLEQFLALLWKGEILG